MRPNSTAFFLKINENHGRENTLSNAGPMSRKNRFAPPGYWLHITQRGNDKQRVLTPIKGILWRSWPFAVRSARCGSALIAQHHVGTFDKQSVCANLDVASGLTLPHASFQACASVRSSGVTGSTVNQKNVPVK